MKQTKESKCTSCAYQKQKANGNHSWKVKFENNDEGFINTKENVAPFTEGNVEKYNIEEISIPGKDGNPFKFFGISKFKEPFFKKDDSKERIRAYYLILAKEMVLNGLVALTDDDNAEGVRIVSKMMSIITAISPCVYRSPKKNPTAMNIDAAIFATVGSITF